MKITYTGIGDVNYTTHGRSYRFNKSNDFTVDIQNYSDIYALFRDSRHGLSMRFADDPDVDKIKNYKKPGIITMATNSNTNTGSNIVVSTTTASGKEKVQIVKDIDTEIDSLIDELADSDDTDTTEIINEVKEKTKPKPNKKKAKKK